MQGSKATTRSTGHRTFDRWRSWSPSIRGRVPSKCTGRARLEKTRPPCYPSTYRRLMLPTSSTEALKFSSAGHQALLLVLDSASVEEHRAQSWETSVPPTSSLHRRIYESLRRTSAPGGAGSPRGDAFKGPPILTRTSVDGKGASPRVRSPLAGVAPSPSGGLP
jgi:hypothetical protein